MPVIFQYLVKLSISLAIMYLFYQLVLRRLTFYNHNRWYLAGYSFLCFFISLINIGPVLEGNDSSTMGLVKFIPTVQTLAVKVPGDMGMAEAMGAWTIWSWSLLFFSLGILVMLVRLLLQLMSFRKMTRQATLIADEQVKFYQVDKDIMPFSFGNSIFINQHLHTERELKEIIRHEFVHVKQRHTIDIIWSELLCILNWYNPFVWLIRKAIRQNLEFIADNKVIQGGMDKKQYQYLLLKVVGNTHFSIANQFNFTSLKKRIAMMNKIKTARIQLVKFLFILPLLAVLLLAFRNKLDENADDSTKGQSWLTGIVIDKETRQPLKGAKVGESANGQETTTDENGFFKIPVTNNTGKYSSQMYVIMDGYMKKPFSTPVLSVEKNNSNIAIVCLENDISPKVSTMYLQSYKGEAAYNKVLAVLEDYRQSEVLDATTEKEVKSATVFNAGQQQVDTIPATKQATAGSTEADFLQRHPLIKNITWGYITAYTGADAKAGDPIMQLHFKNGNWDMYNLGNENEVAKFKKNYGETPPAPPATAASPKVTITGKAVLRGEGTQKLNGDVKGISIRASQDKFGITRTPLYIVDGVELPADDIHKLEPDQIESVTVLKDAQSLALYGSKAVNGVVVIVTRAKKITPVTRVTITADTLTWNTTTNVLHMKGNIAGQATLYDPKSDVSVSAESITYWPTTPTMQTQQTKPAVYIEGKLAESDKPYPLKRASGYVISSLTKTEAEKKYGEKGKDGAIEIESDKNER